MALKRMVLQIGMGTDIRGADYTKAAVRALRDALWHNWLSVADAVGLPVDAMQVEVTIGVPRPDRVDKQAVLAVLPHGTGTGAGRRRRARNPQRCGHQFDGHRQCRRGRAARYSVRVAIMKGKRVILEMGSGNDLHGGDYTKAAVRAVAGCHAPQLAELYPDAGRRPADDAGRGHDRRAAAGQGRCRGREGCSAAWPSTVNVVKGGLDVPDEEATDVAVIASAAVAVHGCEA